MKYKVGDRVLIKSFKWYNENKDINGNVHCGDKVFDDCMSVFCGSVVTIDEVYPYNGYNIREDMHCRAWTNEMIEGLVEEETKPKFKVGDILFYRGETSGYLKVEEIREENGEIRYYETSRNVYLVENDPDVFADKVCSVDKQGQETSWKPSKEEMDVLYGLAYITNKYDEHKEEVITRLYQDLKREFFNGSSYENMFPNTENDVRCRSTIQVLEYARSLDSYNQYGKEDIDKNIAWLERYYKPKEPLDIPTMSTDFAKEHGLPCPEGYIFKDENGNVVNATKIVLEKKKKEYPKTYEECCEVLGIGIHGHYALGYESETLSIFQNLIICRNAYWKIAGEEMGLRKPWVPDWNNISDKYCIYFVSGDVWSKECQTRQCPFAFPTPEMRDTFKKNFDPDIEFCKELL